VTGARAAKIVRSIGKAARQNAHLRCATRTRMKPCKRYSKKTSMITQFSVRKSCVLNCKACIGEIVLSVIIISCAMMLMCRAAQRIGAPSRRKKRHRDIERSSVSFPTNFRSLIATSPPPAPSTLLCPPARVSSPASAKVRSLIHPNISRISA